GTDFAKIFCSTLGAALFIYYVFEILQQTKKDSLTGLLNRHAYQADININPGEITALISIDMNGLKTLNDTLGHAAGDEAIVTLALCFCRSLKSRQFGYRVGGDEFVILCRKTSKAETMKLIKRIETSVGETKYRCALGYSYSENGEKSVEDMLKESDMMMYAAKERYYEETGKVRRHAKDSAAN
ncbi:MAG: GGDEF domain-containing protein, partial [Clostridia bacterium]|nr:GGDEF domain-containing protein [Clostridia bacterium]